MGALQSSLPDKWTVQQLRKRAPAQGACLHPPGAAIAPGPPAAAGAAAARGPAPAPAAAGVAAAQPVPCAPAPFSAPFSRSLSTTWAGGAAGPREILCPPGFRPLRRCLAADQAGAQAGARRPAPCYPTPGLRTMHAAMHARRGRQQALRATPAPKPCTHRVGTWLKASPAAIQTKRDRTREANGRCHPVGTTAAS